jgi:hypothetical protein
MYYIIKMHTDTLVQQIGRSVVEIWATKSGNWVQFLVDLDLLTLSTSSDLLRGLRPRVTAASPELYGGYAGAAA